MKSNLLTILLDLLGSITTLFTTDTISDVQYSRRAVLRNFDIVATDLMKIYDSVKLR
jgi:hypothetical protein